jgi:hypothetical protein
MLVRCIHCGRKISSESLACPHCGAQDPVDLTQDRGWLSRPGRAEASGSGRMVGTWLAACLVLLLIAVTLNLCSEVSLPLDWLSN